MMKIEDSLQQVTNKEFKALESAETCDMEKLREKHDPLIDALQLLEHLEDQKVKLEAREEKKESNNFGQHIADRIANFTGSITFVLCNIAFFVLWIIINSGILGISPFDPYPFIFLTFIVSLEAILLSSFILLSQNRQAEKDRMRDEIDYERDRLDLRVDTLAAKTIHHATFKIEHIENELVSINNKLDSLVGAKRPSSAASKRITASRPVKRK